MNKKILVIGATGKLGEPVARQLLKDGFKVKVFSRNVNKAKEQLDDRFEYVRGDVSDLATINTALEDCWGIHFSLRGGFTTEELNRVEYQGLVNTINAAKKNDVRRFVFLSIAVDLEKARWFPMADVKLKSENALMNSGIPYTIFSATSFYENFPQMIRSGKASTIGKQPNLWRFVSADDFAKMVSKSFQLDQAANKKFYVLGPEALTIKEGLSKYLKIVHPEIKKVSSVSIGMIAFIGTVTFNRELKYLAELMRFFEREKEYGDSKETDELLGAARTTIEQWAKNQIDNSGLN